ncbi:histidine kinase [Acidimicrobium ferrooxidans DSM 10331]|uniref:histidine kinase n=1 Tax=Acidimicrobium ferrooxidans (strain DSM 10331 / JCM 15462 / NBRC 103882 / ICP) TaxID=525909 RepID=C7LY44_ACIFD|nr:ATP-binding protein [Acidimicrobium ferrooxidans]ACU53652.1 histidine kinase [Acidimicrobium ferrooxidans DSM 10331]
MRLNSLGYLGRLARSRWRVVRFFGRLAASVVVRTTVAATVAVGLALLASLVATVLVLRTALTRGIVQTARSEAYDIVLLVRNGDVPRPLPLPRGDLAAQIVSSTGQVVAATPNLRGVAPLVNPHHVPPAGLVVTRATSKARSILVGHDIDIRSVLVAEPIALTTRAAATLAHSAVPAQVGSSGVETYYVFTIASLASVDQATRTLVHIFDVVYPLVLLVVASATWWLARRALAPVDQMISDVAEITSSQLDQRVTEPPGDDEIARLAQTMNAMLARLEHALIREKQFIQDASHELKSPLSALRTTLEVGALHPEITDWDESTQIALSEADRMQRLIESLLLLARAETGPRRPASTELDLVGVVEDEVARLERLNPRLSFALATDVHATIAAEPELLRSLVRNLLENAARHATSRVRVRTSTLVTGSLGPGVTLDVDDDGPGIPPDRRDEVFERFARLDTARARHDGGTGLGLAIVRSVAVGLGGRVRVLDSDLGGARFRVELPTATVTAAVSFATPLRQKELS